MNNATPALLAFLLVLSVPLATVAAGEPAGGADDGSPAVVQQQVSPLLVQAEVTNSTNRLQLTGDVRSGYTEYRPGLGMALASADDGLRIDHQQYAIVGKEFESASDEKRAAMLQTAYEQLMQRANELEQRERAAVSAHAAGELSTAGLLQTLLRNHNEAAVLSERLDELYVRSNRVSEYSISKRQIRADTLTFGFHQTPLRETITQGTQTPIDGHHDVSVSTSQNGYSLSLISGDRYVVETVRFDNRDRTAPDRFASLEEALEHSRSLYPWTDEHKQGLSFEDNSQTPENYYWTEFGHTQGRLEVYLDGGTGEVFREIQVLTASSLPQTDRAVGPWIGDGLNMTMNKTARTGPVEVTVTDQETNEPVDAAITFDGVEVGRTGDDGTLWVIPLIGSHELEAKTASGTVNATVTR
ncbi:DUF7096 domain-containing protein [Natrinema marinum]|uniref:DUF7096 domain-containing protein n=1 Tax=Natrinema marinum TaxID=2961598 RepID=UPI0020C8DD28|nr:hypothetical protein [Natrinema marinum]